jgi:putative ABC transport system permease protein
VLFNRSGADRDVADEVQHYLEQATEAHIARGLPADRALRAARLELGGVTNVSEQMRSYGWENAVDSTLGDLRYAARRLRSAPGFTTVTVLTLALGIGATTAIFSAVNPILFESLPYPDADRITMIWEVRRDEARNDGTFGMYRGLAERSRSLQAIAVFKPWQPTIPDDAQPERLEGQRVSASYFHVLGISPVLGRDFEASHDRLNGPNVVVLSHGLWQRRFGADPRIVGSNITLDDTDHQVIGVMPARFENVLAPDADLWAPLQYDMSQGRAWGHHLRMVGRLAPGTSTAAVTRELNALGQAVLEEHRPETYGPDVLFGVASLQDDITRGVRPALLAIFGAVTLLLVIACVNVTNLLLARGAGRRSEFALRAALGAGGGRLVRQLLTETVLLAALSGVMGMAVALLGTRAFVTLSPPELPRVADISVDRAVFAFGLAITTLFGLACGLAPALQAMRTDPQRELQLGSRRTAGGHRRMRSVLVVLEVALALMLLVSSGLLLRSLQHLFAIDAGFDASHLLTLQVQTSGHRFDEDSTTYRFFAQALEAVRSVPGVTAAALTSQLPLSGDLDLYGVHFDPDPSNDPGEVNGTFRYAVSPLYLETMRIPLRTGRSLDERDRADAPYVALISESMARRRLPGVNPLGQRLRIGAADGPLYTVVGVVGDVRQVSLAVTESDAVYISPAQWHFADNAMSLVVRAGGDAASLAAAVRQAVWSVDKGQPIVRMVTMDKLLANTAAEQRFALIVFEAFALAALVLAAAGIYGVISGNVAERTREIGVRSALGASRRNILALVLRHGMVLTVLGVAVGLVGAAAASQALSALLFGVSPLDAVTYVSMIALLVAVSLVACGLPARRAARLDPATTLRAE